MTHEISNRTGWRKSAHAVCRTLLLVLIFVWGVILASVILGSFAGGIDGARGNLHRLILIGTDRVDIDRDPVAAVSRGYERLLVLLLITWALAAVPRSANDPDPPATTSFSANPKSRQTKNRIEAP